MTSLTDTSLQSTILHALSRLNTSSPTHTPDQIKYEFIDASLRQRCHIPLITSQRKSTETSSPFVIDQSWESEAVDLGFARADVRDKNRARGSSPERSVFSAEQQKLAHHYVKALTDATGNTLSAISKDPSVTRALPESAAVQGFAKVLSTLSLSSQPALLGTHLQSHVDSLKKLRMAIGVRRDINISEGVLQLKAQSHTPAAPSASLNVNTKKRPRSDDTDAKQSDIIGEDPDSSSGGVGVSRQGLFDAIERGNRRSMGVSSLHSSTAVNRDIVSLSNSSSSSSSSSFSHINSSPPHELRFLCAIDSLSRSSNALLKSLDFWGQTLDRVSDVCGKFNQFEDTFAAQADSLTARISHLHLDVVANENKFLIQNTVLMNLLANNSDQTLVTQATEERGSIAATLKLSKDLEAESIAARAWYKELAELCNAGRNFTLVSMMRAQTSLQRHTAHALFTVDSSMVEFFAALCEWSAAEALRYGDGSATDVRGGIELSKDALSLRTHLNLIKNLSSLIRLLPKEVFDAFTKRSDFLHECSTHHYPSLKEKMLNALDVSTTFNIIKDSAKEIAKTSSIHSPIWQVLLPPNSTTALVDAATTSLFNPPAIRHLKLSTKAAQFDLGLLERVVDQVGVKIALGRAIVILTECVSERGKGLSLFQSQSVMYPGPIPPLLQSTKPLQQQVSVPASGLLSHQQAVIQPGVTVVPTIAQASVSVVATTASRRLQEELTSQSDKQTALRVLGSGGSVVIPKEAIQRSKEEQGKVVETSSKKFKKDPEVIDVDVKDEDDEKDLTVGSSPSIGLKPSSLNENDGEDSESEAACIVM